MQIKTTILATFVAFSAVPAYAQELGSTISSSDAIYSVDASSSLKLRAVQGTSSSPSLIVANHTEQTITINDLNGTPVVVVKSGKILDLGPALDRLPEFVVVKGIDDAGGHYVQLTRGLSLTISSRVEDAS